MTTARRSSSRGVRPIILRDNTFWFQWQRIAHEGNLLHDLRVGYIPRNFYNTNRNEGGPPLAADGQLRSSRAPSVNITNTANFGSGYSLLDMYTKPVQGTYSTRRTGER